jgi:hypothetical protein
MLGKRSESEYRDDNSFSQMTASFPKSEFINRFMLNPENITDKEAFILKFFVDYEYPESQKYLKSFWKNLIIKTYARHFNCVSGKQPSPIY